MSKLAWYFNRLRAMNVPEVYWRLQQKRLQQHEASVFEKKPQSVCSIQLDNHSAPSTFNADAIGLNFHNSHHGTCTSIHLPGGYDYDTYKTQWNAGFQTENTWPHTFSYALKYKQCDNIGDARTNWELNRHFQFALMAKAWYVTRSPHYGAELEHLFTDWNSHNAFLHGISWTSVMEVAIRLIQWCVSLSFLKAGGYADEKDLLSDMEKGIRNMATYVAAHYSRYSSANNHLLVEATALAFAGFGLGHKQWTSLAISLLDEELLKQNYTDGVNKEVSLHYQTFGMEAYALVAHLMLRHGLTVSPAWIEMLQKQCEFVIHSMVDETHACEFGDNDEGKVLDLEGGHICHYRYVLQLCSLVTGQRYESFNRISETISWLFTDEEIKRCKSLPLYEASASRTFPEGGYTFMRSRDQRIVIGIDHAPLGFGSIAAHGHADALSFQLYADGKAIFGDPGTFIYHCMIEQRNAFRQSANHNTVWTDGEEQSQMMGAFLWGKKAHTAVTELNIGNNKADIIEAVCTWWSGQRHTRRFTFDKEQCLIINDNFRSAHNGTATFILHPDCNVTVCNNVATIVRDGITVKMEADATPEIHDAWYSEEYGIKRACQKLTLQLNNNQLTTKIWIEKF